jgi:DNA polymerase I-like protein with 3'-5' exonuclease and polymerase domains
MIRAPKGKILVACDLSQAESWIVAYKANEPSMKRALSTGDIHAESGVALFFPDKAGCRHTWIDQPEGAKLCIECKTLIVKTARYVGKRYNHASAYRMKAPRAAQVINKDSDKPPFVTVTIKESDQFSKRWHGYYNIKPWWYSIEETLTNNARTMVTAYGRERTFYGPWGDELFKEATAFEPQSVVADHFKGKLHPLLGIKGGLIEVYNQLVSNEIKIINESHDSCILEVPQSIGSEICERLYYIIHRPLIVNGEQFTIPVDVEMGDRWGEMEKVQVNV